MLIKLPIKLVFPKVPHVPLLNIGIKAFVGSLI